MRRVFRAVGLAAILAAVFSMSIPVAQASGEFDLVAPSDPPGATCYHFPLITVCCDGGGCYIL
jgi:hypothetical protein